MEQIQLSVGKRAHRNHDYLDLFPGRVMPMGDIDILEQGSNLLVIKSYEHGKKVMPKHLQIAKILAATSNAEGAQSNISFVFVWGLGPTTRTYKVVDYQGEGPFVETDIDGWRYFLACWWRDNKRRGR